MCSSVLQVSVSGGVSPTFSWNEACRVWAFRVGRMNTGSIQWYMGKDDESLDDPIRYGQLPSGAVVFDSAQPLQAGTTYRAVLVQRSEGGRILAATTFRP